MMLHTGREAEKERGFRGIVFFILVMAGVWAFCQLLDSPRPWFDEGIYLQAGKLLAEEGRFGLRVTPEIVENLKSITVGYPLIAPLAGFFFVFGSSLEVARIMMVLFLLAFLGCGALLSRKLYGRKAGVTSALLLASFAPLYGNGKNVLGEVPGLFYLMISTLCLLAIERGKRGWKIFFIFGLFLSFAMATKPHFLVLAPALVVAAAVLFLRKWRPTFGELGAFCVAVALGFGLWLITQFAGGDLVGVWNHYANPYAVQAMGEVIKQNLRGFVSDATPLHFLFLALIVFGGWFMKGWKKVTATEYFLGVFILLIWVAYLRTVGWYRYFFLAHAVLVLLAGGAVWYFKQRTRRSWLVTVGLVIVLGAQLSVFLRDPFPLYGREWRLVRATMQQIPPSATILFANATEAAFFFPGHSYTQYLRITDELHLGKVAIGSFPFGLPEYIVMTDQLDEISPWLGYYRLEMTAGHVTVWHRIPRSTDGRL